MPKTKKIKAWLVLRKKNKVIWGIDGRHRSVWKYKPRVNNDFITIPCTITYQLPITNKKKK